MTKRNIFRAKLLALPRIPGKRRQKNPGGDMTIVGHLQELRLRVVYSVLGLAIGTMVGFFWYQHTILGITSLGDILRAPYCDLPPDRRAALTTTGECKLLATSPFEMFMLRLRVGALAGCVLASPVWLYNLWAFVTPGLHKKERRYTFSFVTIAVMLFVTGAIIAYFVLSFGLEFLLGLGNETQVAALSGGAYFGYVLALIVIFGVSFEVPLLIATLNLVGVLRYETLRERRRIIVVILFIFAAFMTPGGDPFSMLVLGCALSLLMELSIQFTRWNDRRRNEERPDWMDLDDDQASSFVGAPGGIGAPEPIDAGGVGPSAPVAPTPVPVVQQVPRQPGVQPSPAPQAASYFDDVL